MSSFLPNPTGNNTISRNSFLTEIQRIASEPLGKLEAWKVTNENGFEKTGFGGLVTEKVKAFLNFFGITRFGVDQTNASLQEYVFLQMLEQGKENNTLTQDNLQTIKDAAKNIGLIKTTGSSEELEVFSDETISFVVNNLFTKDKKTERQQQIKNFSDSHTVVKNWVSSHTIPQVANPILNVITSRDEDQEDDAGDLKQGSSQTDSGETPADDSFQGSFKDDSQNKHKTPHTESPEPAKGYQEIPAISIPPKVDLAPQAPKSQTVKTPEHTNVEAPEDTSIQTSKEPSTPPPAQTGYSTLTKLAIATLTALAASTAAYMVGSQQPTDPSNKSGPLPTDPEPTPTSNGSIPVPTGPIPVSNNPVSQLPNDSWIYSTPTQTIYSPFRSQVTYFPPKDDHIPKEATHSDGLDESILQPSDYDSTLHKIVDDLQKDNTPTAPPTTPFTPDDSTTPTDSQTRKDSATPTAPQPATPPDAIPDQSSDVEMDSQAGKDSATPTAPQPTTPPDAIPDQPSDVEMVKDKINDFVEISHALFAAGAVTIAGATAYLAKRFSAVTENEQGQDAGILQNGASDAPPAQQNVLVPPQVVEIKRNYSDEEVQELETFLKMSPPRLVENLYKVAETRPDLQNLLQRTDIERLNQGHTEIHSSIEDILKRLSNSPSIKDIKNIIEEAKESSRNLIVNHLRDKYNYNVFPDRLSDFNDKNPYENALILRDPILFDLLNKADIEYETTSGGKDLFIEHLQTLSFPDIKAKMDDIGDFDKTFNAVVEGNKNTVCINPQNWPGVSASLLNEEGENLLLAVCKYEKYIDRSTLMNNVTPLSKILGISLTEPGENGEIPVVELVKNHLKNALSNKQERSALIRLINNLSVSDSQSLDWFQEIHTLAKGTGLTLPSLEKQELRTHLVQRYNIPSSPNINNMLPSPTPYQWAVQHSDFTLFALLLEAKIELPNTNFNADQSFLKIRPQLDNLAKRNPKLHDFLSNLDVQQSKRPVGSEEVYEVKKDAKIAEAEKELLTYLLKKFHIPVSTSASTSISDLLPPEPYKQAIQQKDFNLITLLLKADIQPLNMSEVLIDICRTSFKKDVSDLIQQLIAKGCDINAQDDTGLTPLASALRAGNEDIAKLLLEKHARIDITDNLGNSPLAYALQRNVSLDLVKELVKPELINFPNVDGLLPLHHVIKQMIDNTSNANDAFNTFNFFLDNGADPDLKPSIDVTPREYVDSTLNSKEKLSEKTRGLLEQAKARFPSATTTTTSSSKVKSSAGTAKSPAKQELQSYLEDKYKISASSNLADILSDSFYKEAIDKKDFELFALLLKAGVQLPTEIRSSPSLRSIIPKGAYQWALDKKNFELYAFLLEAKISSSSFLVDSKFFEILPKSPYQWALDKKNFQLFNFLLHNHQEEHPSDELVSKALKTLCEAPLEEHSQELIKNFIAKGANINQQDDKGRSLLAVALSNGKEKLAQLLLIQKAAVNTIDNMGDSPLSYCIKNSSSSSSSLHLIRNLVHPDIINQANSEGLAPLHHILMQAQSELAFTAMPEIYQGCTSLLLAGASPYLKPSGGQTPQELLDTALENVNSETPPQIQRLLKFIQTEFSKHTSPSSTTTTTTTSSSKVKSPVKKDEVTPEQELQSYLKAKYKNSELTDPIYTQALAEEDFKLFALLLKAGIPLPNIEKVLIAACGADYDKNDMSEVGALIQQLIAQGCDINAQDDKGLTPLASALSAGNEDFAWLLLQNNATSNTIDNEGNSPLSHGLQNYVPYALVEKLIHPEIINHVNNRGYTPLHDAIDNMIADVRVAGDNPLDHEDALSKTFILLLDNGADPDLKTPRGKTPKEHLDSKLNPSNVLIQPSLSVKDSEDPEVTRRLLESAKAKLELRSHLNQKYFMKSSNFTKMLPPLPYNWAIAQKDIKAFALFFKVGITPPSPGFLSQVLRTTCGEFYQPKDMDDVRELIEQLIANGCDINTQDNLGRTPLAIALSQGYEDIAKLLLKHKAKIDITDNIKNSPLVYALQKNLYDLASQLIHSNIINLPDLGGLTPLHHLIDQMVKTNDPNPVFSVFIALQGKGANPDLKTTFATTPRKYLDSILSDPEVSEKSKETLKQGKTYFLEPAETPTTTTTTTTTSSSKVKLPENPVGFEELVSLIKKDPVSPEEKQLQSYLKQNYNISASSSLTGRQYEKFFSEKDFKLFALLLKAGIPLPDMQKHLLDACSASYDIDDARELIKQLLTEGCDINQPDASGLTPLATALHANNEDFARLLLENNAAINTIDRGGNSPLSHSLHNDLSYDLVEKLVHPDIINQVNNKGYTPLHQAIDNMITCIQDKEDVARDKSMEHEDALSKTFLLLLDKGADPDLKVFGSPTPKQHLESKLNPSKAFTTLHSEHTTRYSVDYSKDPEVTRRLLKSAKAKLELRSHLKEKHRIDSSNFIEMLPDTPYEWALDKKDIKAFTLFLKAGINLPSTDFLSEALIAVCGASYETSNSAEDVKDLLEELIAQGCDINKTDPSGSTPLIIALRASNKDFVQPFLNNGARIDIVDDQGNSPLSYCLKNNLSPDLAKQLIHRKIINHANEDSQTPLHHVIAQIANTTSVEAADAVLHTFNLLIGQRANPDLKPTDDFQTPREFLDASLASLKSKSKLTRQERITQGLLEQAKNSLPPSPETPPTPPRSSSTDKLGEARILSSASFGEGSVGFGEGSVGFEGDVTPEQKIQDNKEENPTSSRSPTISLSDTNGLENRRIFGNAVNDQGGNGLEASRILPRNSDRKVREFLENPTAVKATREQELKEYVTQKLNLASNPSTDELYDLALSTENKTLLSLLVSAKQKYTGESEQLKAAITEIENGIKEVKKILSEESFKEENLEEFVSIANLQKNGYPLSYAVQNGRIDLLKALLAAGADINEQNISRAHLDRQKILPDSPMTTALKELVVALENKEYKKQDALYEMISVLKNAGLSLTAPNEKGDIPILSLIKDYEDLENPQKERLNKLVEESKAEIYWVKEAIRKLKPGSIFDDVLFDKANSLIDQNFSIEDNKNLALIDSLITHYTASSSQRARLFKALQKLPKTNNWIRPALLTTSNGDVIDFLLSIVDVNEVGSDGKTVLIAACEALTSKNLIDTLISKGSDINKKDNLGRTPLAIALSTRNEKLALLLLEKKAHTNTVDKMGHSPLSYALKNNSHLNLLQKLVHPDLINQADNEGWAPLHHVLHQMVYSTDVSIHNKLILLLDKGADPDLKPPMGKSPRELLDEAVKKRPLPAENYKSENPTLPSESETLRKVLSTAKIDPRIRSAVEKGHISTLESIETFKANVGEENFLKRLEAAKFELNIDPEIRKNLEIVKKYYPYLRGLPEKSNPKLPSELVEAANQLDTGIRALLENLKDEIAPAVNEVPKEGPTEAVKNFDKNKLRNYRAFIEQAIQFSNMFSSLAHTDLQIAKKTKADAHWTNQHELFSTDLANHITDYKNFTEGKVAAGKVEEGKAEEALSESVVITPDMKKFASDNLNVATFEHDIERISDNIDPKKDLYSYCATHCATFNPEKAKMLIQQGRELYNDIINTDVEPATDEEVASEQFAALSWLFMDIALKKSQGFNEGAFIIELDPDQKLSNFLFKMPHRIERYSSHFIKRSLDGFVTTPLGSAANQHEVSVPPGLMPAHKLCGLFSLIRPYHAINPNVLFFKPENYPANGGVGHTIAHGFEYIQAQYNKIATPGSDDLPEMQKERIPVVLTKKFSEIIGNLLKVPNIGAPFNSGGIRLDLAKDEAREYGIAYMDHFIKVYDSLHDSNNKKLDELEVNKQELIAKIDANGVKELVEELKRMIKEINGNDPIELRTGKEVIITQDDLLNLPATPPPAPQRPKGPNPTDRLRKESPTTTTTTTTITPQDAPTTTTSTTTTTTTTLQKPLQTELSISQVGIPNPENTTCYRSAVYHLLRMTPSIRELLKSPLVKSTPFLGTKDRILWTGKNMVRRHLNSLFNYLEAGAKPITISRAEKTAKDSFFIFCQKIKNSDFTQANINNQNDAAAYLRIILSELLDMKVHCVESNWIPDTSTGELTKLDRGEESVFEPFFMLNPDLQADTNDVQQMIDSHFTEEKIHGSEKVKKLQIEGEPQENLILQFHRVEVKHDLDIDTIVRTWESIDSTEEEPTASTKLNTFENELGKMYLPLISKKIRELMENMEVSLSDEEKKAIFIASLQELEKQEITSSTHLQFPKTLDLSKAFEGKNAEYELTGFIRHTSGGLGGHYTAYVNQDPTTQDRWDHFDDERVTPLNRAEIEQAKGQASIAFFRKKG